jgi:hypothetical protein
MPKINWKQCLAWVAVADGEKHWSSTTFIDKHWWIGDLKIRIYWRNPDGLMGRFGGGWNWKLGLQWSSSSVIINCLVFSITLYAKKGG